MRILIVSDTHKYNDNLVTAVKQTGKADLMIHLGDAEVSKEKIEEIAGCPVYIVAGNNDFFYDFPTDEEIDLLGHHIFLTHGHYYHVSFTIDYLIDEALDRKASVAMYGHTHRPLIEKKRGVLVINPGSLSYPRQEGRRPTYAIMELEENKEPAVKLFEIHK